MIEVKLTGNLGGFEISGDHNDLHELYEALSLLAHTGELDSTGKVVFNKQQEPNDDNVRFLALNYEIRKAFMGDRDVKFVDNGMSEELMKHHGLISSPKNVYYSTKVHYPEMIYDLMMMNVLIENRIRGLGKKKNIYAIDTDDPKIFFDETIITIRAFQSAINKAMKKVLAPSMMTRWLKAVNNKYSHIKGIYHQWLDVQNHDYSEMDREKRKKSMFKIAKNISGYQYNEEYKEVQLEVYNLAKENNIPFEQVRFQTDCYESEID